MPVHTNLKALREAKGVTKTFLANGLGMSLQGYSYLENGEVNISVERIKEIARLLGEPVNVFFDDKLTETVIKRYETAQT